MNLERREFLALAGVGALSGCCEVTAPQGAPRSPGTWNNAVDSLRDDVKPGVLAYPGSTRAVIELVRAAEAMGQRVRMTGSGHSFSDVALTDDVLILPNRLGL